MMRILKRIRPKLLPPVAILEITYLCNHNCLFCYCPWEAERPVYPRSPEMSVREWKRLIDALAWRGVISFTFSGGEPLLKPGFEQILRHAGSKIVDIPRQDDETGKFWVQRSAAEVCVISNGRALSDFWLDNLAEVNGMIELSLPGLRTFKQHTGFDGAETVLNWMRRASNRGIYVVANVTATQRNLPELFETIGQALLHGASSLLLNRFLPGGRGLSHMEELWLTQKQTIEAFDIAENVLSTANRRGSVGTEVPRCILGERKYERLQVNTGCSAAVDFFAVDPAGYFRVCNHSQVRLTRWTRIPQLLRHPYWQKFAQKDYMPEQCSGCAHIPECGAGCREMAHIVCGDITSPDPIMYEQNGTWCITGPSSHENFLKKGR